MSYFDPPSWVSPEIAWTTCSCFGSSLICSQLLPPLVTSLWGSNFFSVFSAPLLAPFRRLSSTVILRRHSPALGPASHCRHLHSTAAQQQQPSQKVRGLSLSLLGLPCSALPMAMDSPLVAPDSCSSQGRHDHLLSKPTGCPHTLLLQLSSTVMPCTDLSFLLQFPLLFILSRSLWQAPGGLFPFLES